MQHANRCLPDLKISPGRVPKLMPEKEALVVWNERSTQCLFSAYSIFYDGC